MQRADLSVTPRLAVFHTDHRIESGKLRLILRLVRSLGCSLITARTMLDPGSPNRTLRINHDIEVVIGIEELIS